MRSIAVLRIGTAAGMFGTDAEHRDGGSGFDFGAKCTEIKTEAECVSVQNGPKRKTEKTAAG